MRVMRIRNRYTEEYEVGSPANLPESHVASWYFFRRTDSGLAESARHTGLIKSHFHLWAVGVGHRLKSPPRTLGHVTCGGCHARPSSKLELCPCYKSSTRGCCNGNSDTLAQRTLIAGMLRSSG